MNLEKIEQLNKLRQKKLQLLTQKAELLAQKEKFTKRLQILSNRDETLKISIEHHIEVDNAQRDRNSIQAKISENAVKIMDINKQEMELRGVLKEFS